MDDRVKVEGNVSVSVTVPLVAWPPTLLTVRVYEAFVWPTKNGSMWDEVTVNAGWLGWLTVPGV
jgi:hypothetical protein